MSKHSGVKQTLELLNHLKATVGEFTAREEKLQKEFNSAIAAVRHRRDKSSKELNEQWGTRVSEATLNFQTAQEAAEAKFKARKIRITQAHRQSKQQALRIIGDKEGRRKHKIQTETMQMHRSHDTGRATAEKNVIEFKTSLAQEQEVFATLEKRARNSFKGYGKFVRALERSEELSEADLAKNEYDLIAELDALLNQTRDELDQLDKSLLPKLTRGFLLNFTGKQDESQVMGIADRLARARRLHDVCWAKADSRYAREIERVENEFKAKKQWVEDEWKLTLEDAARARESSPETVDAKFARTGSTNERQHQVRIDKLKREHDEHIRKLTGEIEEQTSVGVTICEEQEAKLNAQHQAQWKILEAEWKERIEPLYESIRVAISTAENVFPDWNATSLKNWTAPERFEQAAQFAHLEVQVEKLAGGIPKDPRLPLPGPAQFSLPLLLTYPEQGSLLIETKELGRDEAIAALNNIFLRLLSVASPGKASFTVIDPVGLGQSFSGVMHLADFAEHLINGKIWTQSGQIEEKLAELNEHMEKVIQMYLRNEYETIAEYNEQAGNIAEKYHFLVVANFPANFSEVAIKRLLSIATSGARCGVYTLIHWDHAQPTPLQFIPDELKNSSVSVAFKGRGVALEDQLIPGTNLVLDPPPPADFVTEFIQKVGQISRDSNRVEVPFEHVAPSDTALWSEETTNELRVPIGRTGATKLQYLAIGKGTRQHALIAGKTGSGKSTLFHIIVTNLALWCSPEEVEFYLIDFKKGVEFKCYADKRLPHARVVAIESDREFGLSVLQRVDEELKHRGELFRKLGVQDLAGYKRAGGTEPMPRSLLMIDEFQEFFTEDDKVSQGASVLLDRIVRQGRAFGIHVILGSQTLGGAYTMARATMGQMVIRIALQCNEADAYLIMDDNNPAPRLLSRPGEGIYNDAAGNILGNSPFQAVWLPDNVRDTYLDKIRDRAEKSSTKYPGPIVFEGDAPADVRENSVLNDLLMAESIKPATVARIWLGAPNSIKGPTEAAFQRQSGNNLLIVGQGDEAILAILSIAFISLAAQFPIGKANFILFDGNPPGSQQREYFDKVAQSISHKITVVKPNDIAEVMNGLSAEMKRRAESESTNEDAVTFLFIHGLQKFGKLRNEDEFSFSSDDSETAPSPAAQLNKLITEGPSLGIHVIVTCDTYNNVNRFLSKKAFSEFEMRVLFQMSANDSASLIDNPKASTLGLHRALFYNEQEGYLELFRPYALPQKEWLDRTRLTLSRLPWKRMNRGN